MKDDLPDVRKLRVLLRELRSAGVSRFRAGAVEIELGADPRAVPVVKNGVSERAERLPTSWADLEVGG